MKFDIDSTVHEFHPKIHQEQKATKRHLRSAKSIFESFESSGFHAERHVILLHPETRSRLGARSILKAKLKTGEVRSILYLEKQNEYIHESSMSTRIQNNNRLAQAAGSLLMVVVEHSTASSKFITTRWIPTDAGGAKESRNYDY